MAAGLAWSWTGKQEVERLVNSAEFYAGIQIKPRIEDRIVLDEKIVRLTRMLFVGLVTDRYAEEWVRTHFLFRHKGFLLSAPDGLFHRRGGGAPGRQAVQEL